jgi:hypothetical protein
MIKPKSFLSTLRRLQWIFITLLVLGGSFFYYFNVVINRNELLIKERSFRGLAHISENIEKTITATFLNNARNFANEFLKSRTKAETAEIQKLYGLSFTGTSIPGKDTFFISGKSNSRYFNFNVKNSNGEWKTVQAGSTTFLDSVLRNDLFSHYLVIANGELIYENVEGSFSLSLKDSLKVKSALQPGLVQKLEAGGESFEAFSIPFIVEGKEWWLSGLMPYSDFRKEKMQLSENIVVTLIFIFFLSLIFFPFLKCFLMNKEDHLNSSDVVFAYISFFLITATLTAALWNLYTFQSLYRNGRNDQLYQLAAQIETSFGQEIKQAIGQLKEANETLAKNSGDDASKIRMGLVNNLNPDAAYDSIKAKFNSYPYAKNIVWLDKSGQQKIRWTAYNFNPEKINVKSRAYFQQAIDNNLWTDSSGNSFFVEAIKSWIADSKLGVVSMRSGLTKSFVDTAKTNLEQVTMPVMLLSGRFQSVFQPILPSGFGFAVLNQEGKVYFHSNPQYDLFEDFIKETGGHYLLSAALQTRMATEFKAYYYGQPCKFYIQPVKDMPLFVVTFSETYRINANNTALLTSVSVLIFLQAFLIILSAILIQIFRVRESRSGIRTNNLNWLIPKSEHLASYSEHIWLFSLMILVEILLGRPLPFLLQHKPDDSLFTLGIVFTFSILSTGFSYYLIRVRSGKEFDHSNAPHWKLLSGIAFLYLIVLVPFLVVIGQHGIGLLLNFLLVQALAFVIIIYISKINLAGNRIIQSIFSRRQDASQEATKHSTPLFIRLFKTALFLFIILNSVVAVTLLYRQSYDQETLLLQKNQQLNLVQSYWKKRDTITLKNNNLSGRYYQNIIADTLHPTNRKSFSIQNEGAAFSGFYRWLRPVYQDHARSHGALSDNQNADITYQWQHTDSSLNFYASQNNLELKQRGIGQLFVGSARHPLSFPGLNFYPGSHARESKMSIAFIYYILFALVLLPGIWLLVSVFIKRVLVRSLPEETESVTTQLSRYLFHAGTRHLMVVGLPDSGKAQTVKRLLSEYSGEMSVKFGEIKLTDRLTIAEQVKNLETFLIPSENEGRKTKYFVLVRNFEYCFHDHELTKVKLELLESLLHHREWNIILFSTTHSFPFTEHYFNIINGKISAEETEIKAATASAERWVNVLDNFPVFYFRHQPGIDNSRENIPEFISSECEKSDFLEQLVPQLMPAYRKLDETLPLQDLEDELEIKISQVGTFYYDSVWLTLTKEERRVLYDFAKDGLVNDYYFHELCILKQKGLLTYENHEMKLMNRSFRNYILTQLDKDELHKLKENDDGKGIWTKLRMILIFVIVIVGIFLFITQEEALNNLIAYLTAFSGGIFALLNIVNKIPGGSK